MNRIRGILIRLSIPSVSLILTLLVLEAGVRLFAPQQLILMRPDIWKPANTLGWRMASHLNTKVNTGERTVSLYTDAHGRRIGSGPQEDKEGAYKILAVGDSFLAALQVEHEQILTTKLQRIVAEELDVSVNVVNSSVGGWNPNHYLMSATEELAREDYDLVVVFLYAANDVVSKRVREFRPRRAEARHNFRFPSRLSYRELVNAIGYPINDFLETRSHLFILFKDKARFFLMRIGLSPRYFPDVYLLSEADSSRWRVTAEICADIDAKAAAKNIPVLFTLLPPVNQVDKEMTERYMTVLGIDPELVDLEQPRRLLTAEFAKRGLKLLDASAAFKAAYEADRSGV